MSTHERARRPGRDALLFWAVVALAGAVRLLHVYFTGRDNPLAADLQLDAATYDRWARALAFGGDTGPTTLMQAPLYPWFVSLVYRLAGPSLAAVRLAQAILGTATCGLVMFSARLLFRSRAAAIFAGLFAALYAPFLFYEGLLLPASLVVFLNVLFVAVTLSGERPAPARMLVSGLVLGAAAAANPPTILLGAFALAHGGFAGAGRPDGPAESLVGAAQLDAPAESLGGPVGAPAHPGDEGPRRAKRLPARRFAAPALALALGTAAALAPVTIVNAVKTGEFIPLTAGAGINFYHGNNPGANGFYRVPVYKGTSLGGTPEEQAVNMARVASSESGRELSPPEVSRFWLRVGFDFIRREPRAWGALLWNKFRFFWNVYERSNVESFSFQRRFPGMLSLPLLTFGFIAPLGLLGIFLTRARWRGLWLPYGGVLAYLFVALAFYVLARYRLPAVPFLAMFAGAAVVELYDLARRRRAAELALALAALGVLALFCDVPAAKDTPEGIAAADVRLGRVYLERGDVTNAERAFREALDRDPSNETAKRGLEMIRGTRGRARPGGDAHEIR
jgi:hypothetical protein